MDKIKLPTTIEEVREFVQKYPQLSITAPWGDMLYDMDEFGEEYTIGDFLEELDVQEAEGNFGAEEFFTREV